MAEEFLTTQKLQEFCAGFGDPELNLAILLRSTEFLPLALEKIHHYNF